MLSISFNSTLSTDLLENSSKMTKNDFKIAREYRKSFLDFFSKVDERLNQKINENQLKIKEKSLKINDIGVEDVSEDFLMISNDEKEKIEKSATLNEEENFQQNFNKINLKNGEKSSTTQNSVRKKTQKINDCIKCSKKIYPSSGHKIYHDLIDTKMIMKCKICPFTTKSAYPIITMRSHFKIYHENQKIDFEIIKEEFAEKWDPEEHAESSKVKCEKCGKLFHKFSIKNHLKVHELVNEGKILKCTQCDYKNLYRSEIIKHFRIKHKNCNSEKFKIVDSEKFNKFST